MKLAIADVVTALVISGISALGGAAVVFSEYDDAPGGVLLGLLLVLASVALGLRTARHTR